MTLSLSPGWADELVALLDQQVRVYEQLRELSERQGRFVAEGEAEALLRLLGQRQQLIDELTRLNERMEPMRRDWPDRIVELDEDSRQRVNGLVDRVQGLLAAIMQQDERDRESLSGQRDRAAGDLRSVKTGSAVHKAYGQTGSMGVDQNKFTDQQG